MGVPVDHGGICESVRQSPRPLRELLVASVRGCDHSVLGFVASHGGLMIDLSRMQSVGVDPVRQMARVEGDVTRGLFAHETEAFDLATTGGMARSASLA